MIPNLNFYDIYGYLLPGLTLLSLIWLPYGLSNSQPPSEKLSSLSSALIAIVLGYIVGHLLQMISKYPLPSDIADEFGRRRTPSDRMLDADETTFSMPLKLKLARRIKELFGLDVQVNLRRQDILKGVSANRNEAFFLCRSTLLQSKRGLYGEQFEGMYTLMRGLSTAFVLGAIYHLGWASTGLEQDVSKVIFLLPMLGYAVCVIAINTQLGSARLRIVFLSSLLLFLVTYLVQESLVGEHWRWTAVEFWILTALLVSIVLPDWAKPHQLRTVLAWCKVVPVIFAMFALGSALGFHHRPVIEWHAVLVLVASFEILIAVKCYFSYKHFAQEFPRAIYRDFATAALVKLGEPED